MMNMAKSRIGRNEIFKDYIMLEKIAKELAKHQKNLRAIGKRAVIGARKTDLNEGIVENLDIVSNHMKKAQEEVEKARKKLKFI